MMDGGGLPAAVESKPSAGRAQVARKLTEGCRCWQCMVSPPGTATHEDPVLSRGGLQEGR